MELRRSTRLKKVNAGAATLGGEHLDGGIIEDLPPRYSRNVEYHPKLDGNYAMRNCNDDGNTIKAESDGGVIGDEVLANFPRPRYYRKYSGEEALSGNGGLTSLGAVLQRLVRWKNEWEAQDDTRVQNDGEDRGLEFGGSNQMHVISSIIEQLALFTSIQLQDKVDYDPEKLLADVKTQGVYSNNAVTLQLLNLLEEDSSTFDEVCFNKLAQIHHIDIQDISDMLTIKSIKRNGILAGQGTLASSRKADIQYLSNKWKKLLTRERNIALYWPTKGLAKRGNFNNTVGNHFSRNQSRSESSVKPLPLESNQLDSSANDNARDPFKDIPLYY